MTNPAKVLSFPARMADTLMNVVSGLGVFGQDKKASNAFVMPVYNMEQLEAAYRGDWIARRVIDQLVRDMTREWRSWQGSKTQIAKLEAEEARLGLRAKVTRAKKLARLYGGAAMILGDGTTDPTKPLDIETIGLGGLKYVHVLSRWEINAQELERDPMSPFFGEPKYYTLSAGTGPVDLHPSRVVRFIGAEVPNHNHAQTEGWGDSELQALYQAVLNAASVQENFASIIEEAKLDIIRIPDMMSQIATKEYETRLSKRFQAASLGKSNLNTLILDKDEEWQQRQLTLTGMPDIMRSYLDIASASAGYPAVVFLGVSPGGLNATGLADIRNYYDRVSSEQNSDLGPNLSRVDDALIRSALGRRPSGVHYRWNSLWQLTDSEKADNGLKKAQATNLYGRLGVMGRQAQATAVQNMLIEDGFYPGLEETLKQPGATIPSDPIGGGAAPNGPADKPNPVTDMEPRPLYVMRRVTNAAAIIKWAKAQGFTTTLPAKDLHVTIAYSREPVDWMAAGDDWGSGRNGKLTIAAGGPRIVEKFGNAVVLSFSSGQLSYRHDAIKAAGASWDHPNYQPHITLTYQTGDVDLDAIEPYRGPINLGPEIFEDLDDDQGELFPEE